MSILRSPMLERLAWIDHGFGTREAPLSQDRMASLKQIHSALSLVADRTGCVGEGDALITSQAGVAVSVRSADCFPILLADLRGHVVAAVHAGWRGTAAGIGAEVVRKMMTQFGTSPADVYAAIGPGIRACCYQVGEEVARQFGIDHAGRIDLGSFLRRQLIDTGIPGEQIDVLDACTHCDPERFHSYRRDQLQAGRMISFIRIMGGVA